MKINVDLNKRDAALVQVALENPEMRAFVIIVGALLELPTERARLRVLNYVGDKVEELDEASQRPATFPVASGE